MDKENILQMSRKENEGKEREWEQSFLSGCVPKYYQLYRNRTVQSNSQTCLDSLHCTG